MAERRGLLGPVNADDLEPELGLSEAFSRNPLARFGFDSRAVRQLPFKMDGLKAWTSYRDSSDPDLAGIANGFSRPFSSDDTAMILGIEALPSTDEGGAQYLLHESGHRGVRQSKDTETWPELVKLLNTLYQPKTETHKGLDGEEVFMRMLDFLGGNEDVRAETETFFKQKTGKDFFPFFKENIDTVSQVQSLFQNKLASSGRDPGRIEFRTPAQIGSDRLFGPGGKARPQAVIDEALTRRVNTTFKGLAPYGVGVINSQSKGVSKGRRLEFYPPDERDNPVPGRPIVEIFDPDFKDDDLLNIIAGDGLHLLGKVDPVIAPIRKQFALTLTDEQRETDQRSYKASGDDRDFDDWFEVHRLDQYLGAALLPKGSDNYKDWMGGMTKPQKQLLQQMEYYLRNGPAPDVAPSYEGLING